MISVFIDPYLLAHPKVSDQESEEDISKYVEELVAWRELKSANWARVFLSRSAAQTLIDTNTFPLWNNIKLAVAKLDPDKQTFQVKDILEVVNGLLSKLPFLEDELEILDVLFDGTSHLPNDHLNGRHSLFVEHYSLLLVLMCLYTRLSTIPATRLFLITSHLSNPIDVWVNSEIMLIEFQEPKRALELPIRVEEQFTALTYSSDLKLLIDPVYLWGAASTEEQFRKALDVYLAKRRQLSGLSQEEALDWSFGIEFIQTVRELGFGNLGHSSRIETLLRACSETILRQNMQDTHELRTGAGGNSPQRQRGNQGAWRRDIDYDYHLHYWSGEKRVEFAKVVIHNDMSIPD